MKPQVLPGQFDNRAIERNIFGLDEEVRLGQIGAREHHDSALVQIVAILLAKLVDIAGVKRAVRATRNASGLIAVGSQAVATVALAGNALLGEVLRMAVRAAHHAHTAADALILVLNDSAIFSLADRTRRAVGQADRVLAMVAAARVAVRS